LLISGFIAKAIKLVSLTFIKHSPLGKGEALNKKEAYSFSYKESPKALQGPTL
jgi:hypothetical protein